MALFGDEEGDVGPFVMAEDGEEWFPFTLDNLEMDRGCSLLPQVGKPMEQVCEPLYSQNCADASPSFMDIIALTDVFLFFQGFFVLSCGCSFRRYKIEAVCFDSVFKTAQSKRQVNARRELIASPRSAVQRGCSPDIGNSSTASERLGLD